MLQVDRINVLHGDLQVLWNVSFKINKGEVVTIIGPNCAGKTTILNTISGLLRPRSGSIIYLGKQVEKLPPHKLVKLGIAHVPEGRRLFPQLSVMENLKMGAYTRGRVREKDEMLEWVFQLFPILKERKNQRASTLSGGEQQMLALGRGLMSKPKLLMLDEPSLGLAPKLVRLVFEVIERVNKEGFTILLVEQNVHQALELADRSYVLEEGKIVLEGKGKELINNDHVKKAYLGM